MKRILSLSLAICCLFLLCACNQGPLTGLATPEQARDAGCLVIADDALFAGKERWEAFLKESGRGGAAELRVVQFIEDEPYLEVLTFDGQRYQLERYDRESGQRFLGSFAYLRALTSTEGIPSRQVTRYVLTDSLALTGEDVVWSFLSSDLTTVTTIPFVWLGFLIYLD